MSTAQQITLTQADIQAIERLHCADSLLEYAALGFQLLEPATRKFTRGWVLGAICEHLEAVTNGEIDRLLMNVPPGCMKSLLTRVFWPTWEWGPLNKPGLRTIGASYSDHLARRDNRRAKRLIESPWWQALWGHQFSLMTDQQAAGDFGNDKTGWMLGTTVRGLGTGERGDRFTIDDPHNVKKAESDADRNETVMWFSEVVPTRLNDDDSAIVVIMQRVHERDVSGYILSEGLPYEHLCLPMEWEAPPPTTTVDFGRSKRMQVPTSTRFTDPRSRDGELLWPQRFSRAKVNELKQVLREYAVAGQLQQRPAPRGGGAVKVDQINILDHAPDPRHVVHRVRYWDKAATEDGGKRTAGVRMAILKDGRYVIEHVIKGQWSSGKRESIIKQTAQADPRGTRVYVEQEPGSGGKESAEATIKNLAGFSVWADRPSGDKEVRMEPFASQVEVGDVYAVRGEWLQEWLDELGMFPRGHFKDQADATAGAFNKLAESGANYAALAAM